MRSKKTIPGSIYKPSAANTLVVKFKGRKIHTGLQEGKVGRQLAEQLLMKLWREYIGLDEVQVRNKIMISEAYEKFMKTKVNNLKSTLRNYDTAYKNIIRGDYPIDENKIEEDIQEYLKNTKHGDVSKNFNLSSLNVFISYCLEKEWVKKINIYHNYMKRIETPEIVIYTEEEIATLTEHLDKTDKELSLMIQLMLETGARKVDALTLNWDKVEEDMVIWKNKISKNKEPRPISRKAKEILNKIAEISTGTSTEKVFRWEHSNSTICNFLLNKAFKETKIDRKGRSFQEFRSTFRMKLVKKGVPELYIQYLMRHKSLVTTKKYYSSYEDNVIKQYLD
jgi:integrase